MQVVMVLGWLTLNGVPVLGGARDAGDRSGEGMRERTRFEWGRGVRGASAVPACGKRFAIAAACGRDLRPQLPVASSISASLPEPQDQLFEFRACYEPRSLENRTPCRSILWRLRLVPAVRLHVCQPTSTTSRILDILHSDPLRLVVRE